MKIFSETSRNFLYKQQYNYSIRNNNDVIIPKSKKLKTKRIVLILGSSGSFGASIARHLKSKPHFIIIGADSYVNEISSLNYFLPISMVENLTISSLLKELSNGLERIIGSDSKIIDVIICANGARVMDPIMTEMNEEQLRQLERHHETMMKANYYPVVAAGELARRYMSLNNGLLVTVGSTVAITPTPGMVAYGSSKLAAHHYIRTLGSLTGKALLGKAKPLQPSGTSIIKLRNDVYLDELTAVGLVPTSTLHRPTNMGSNSLNHNDDDFGLYTQDVADEVGKWIEYEKCRPHSGSFIKVSRVKRWNPMSNNVDENVDKIEKTVFRLCR